MAKLWTEKNFEQKYIDCPMRPKQNQSVIDTLREWNLEANSGYNDGYVQKHYRDKLEEVRDYLKTIPSQKEEKDER